MNDKLLEILQNTNSNRIDAETALEQVLELLNKRISLPSDDEIENKAESRQRTRREGNDPKDEFIYGFMEGADWIIEMIKSDET